MCEEYGGMRDTEKCPHCPQVVEPGDEHNCPEKPREIFPGFWYLGGGHYAGYFGDGDQPPFEVC